MPATESPHRADRTSAILRVVSDASSGIATPVAETGHRPDKFALHLFCESRIRPR